MSESEYLAGYYLGSPALMQPEERVYREGRAVARRATRQGCLPSLLCGLIEELSELQSCDLSPVREQLEQIKSGEIKAHLNEEDSGCSVAGGSDL